MATEVTATFEVKGWDENPQDEGEGLPKITRASVTKEFSGDIVGTAALEYLMVYAEDGTAAFVGLERVKASCGREVGELRAAARRSLRGRRREGVTDRGTRIGDR